MPIADVVWPAPIPCIPTPTASWAVLKNGLNAAPAPVGLPVIGSIPYNPAVPWIAPDCNGWKPAIPCCGIPPA